MEMYKPALVLLIVTVIAGGILGGLNSITKIPIAQREEEALYESMGEMFPDSDAFVLSEVTLGPVSKYYEAQNGSEIDGFVIETITKGYGGNIILLTGINTKGEIIGVKVSNHSETPGLGANAEKPEFRDQFLGKTEPLSVVKMASGENEVEAITSATITSDAVTEGVNYALSFYESIILGGGN